VFKFLFRSCCCLYGMTAMNNAEQTLISIVIPNSGYIYYHDYHPYLSSYLWYCHLANWPVTEISVSQKKRSYGPKFSWKNGPYLKISVLVIIIRISMCCSLERA
jgi:hypothetical protein